MKKMFVKPQANIVEMQPAQMVMGSTVGISNTTINEGVAGGKMGNLSLTGGTSLSPTESANLNKLPF